MTEAGALPYRRVPPGGQKYYGPVGLPLHSVGVGSSTGAAATDRQDRAQFPQFPEGRHHRLPWLLRFQRPPSKPDMKFSLIRLSPGQSINRIPRCQRVGGLIPATNRWPGPCRRRRVGKWPLVTASPQPFQPGRTPGYRPFATRVSVLPPVITTTTCSDFRSALHHFAGSLLIGFAATGPRGLAHHDLNLPVPRRISPVPRRTVQPFRPPYPGGYIGAVISKVSTPSMAFAQ